MATPAANSRWLRALTGFRIALTADDAPSSGTPGSVGYDPERMDRVCAILERYAIPHCTAFVVGAAAADEAPRLRRWLAAGYALGNHTQHHRRCSATAVTDFLADVAACDDVLRTVDAFARGPKLFRFPYLDGPGADARGADVRRGLGQLGYRIAHGSIDLWDYRFEPALAAATAAGDERRAAAIERRYVDVVLRTFVLEQRAAARAFGKDAPGIPFFHFGPLAIRCLPAIIEHLRRARVVWLPLPEALDHRAFASPPPTGRASPALQRSLAARFFRRLASLSDRAGLFGQHRLGPRWP